MLLDVQTKLEVMQENAKSSNQVRITIRLGGLVLNLDTFPMTICPLVMINMRDI